MEQSKLLILLLIAFIAYCFMKKTENFPPTVDYCMSLPPLEREVNTFRARCKEEIEYSGRPGYICSLLQDKKRLRDFNKGLCERKNPFEYVMEEMQKPSYKLPTAVKGPGGDIGRVISQFMPRNPRHYDSEVVVY